ncbi:hypothetical protein Kpol_1064p15 [Vanderwaltozyma polyspora DSM 70294]|uniref:SH3 domain-containing protein n=1 Tax=Vanderwaltozyma polyspora (strain ATCC 22028 / DSM 70294 / BCRC 21397 / CBS 2163 / NBRC 10782 / NRRL Y-8283 / UCD 57-17) TaxID=436907 RepID=A7TME0_VANPO|nr:uncharacterized protein Kpol_1064p15 [Vanderwaltozyma polyspora DSM 70294]EDO16534.1 hypothetical protein Kpol_1064p15 [Vanderwaltozyma polyspora DSM 70294]
MSYSYEACFWDQNETGVNVLLGHISSGIRSCNSVISFFKHKSELEKDFARRMGAINDKFLKDTENYPEFGNLNDALKNLLNAERARAQSHSKQSEVIFRQLYTDTKSFSGELQARYTTLSGKIEKLRADKHSKKKGCKELNNRLIDAEGKARALKLNQGNILGGRKAEQNEKDYAKWNAQIVEIQSQLEVLKHEYKASQKFWLSEWADLTRQLQEMETTRISFIQAKIQQYSESVSETSILEQMKMDSLTNHLAVFTAMDDIAKFSSQNGTGRLRSKASINKDSNDYSASTTSSKYFTQSIRNNPEEHNFLSSYSSHHTSQYNDNVRKLSSRLQKRPEIKEVDTHQDRHYQAQEPKIERPHTDKAVPTYQHSSFEVARNFEKPEQDATDDDIEIIKVVPAIKSKRIESRHKPHERTEVLSSSESSSNPTDFTSHVKNRSSVDSMVTSVTSFASNIDDSERFAKSWNNTNRRRKSIVNLQVPSPATSDHEEDDKHERNISINTTIVNPEMSANRNSNKHLRRKSMVLQDSKNPIEDALYEMDRIQSTSTNGFASSNPRVGRLRDNGITVTLPLVTTTGERVIQFAKASYPLLDNDTPGLVNFHKNDYLLITEMINNDWFKGEVYGNDLIGIDHRRGLIPINFIQILG